MNRGSGAANRGNRGRGVVNRGSGAANRGRGVVNRGIGGLQRGRGVVHRDLEYVPNGRLVSGFVKQGKSRKLRSPPPPIMVIEVSLVVEMITISLALVQVCMSVWGSILRGRRL